MAQQMKYVPSLMDVVSAQMDTMESIASLVSLIKKFQLQKLGNMNGDGILLISNILRKNNDCRVSMSKQLRWKCM